MLTRAGHPYSQHSFGLDDEPSASPRKGLEDSRRLSPDDSPHGRRGGAGLTALLLSEPHRLLVPRPLPEVGEPARNARASCASALSSAGWPPGPGRRQFSLADVRRNCIDWPSSA